MPKKLKLYQCEVTKRKKVHGSETDREATGRSRVKQATLDAGPGARGTLYRVDRKHGDALVPVYEVRCVHAGAKGTPALVTEDLTSPPALPED